jgi:hypothetical protein
MHKLLKKNEYNNKQKLNDTKIRKATTTTTTTTISFSGEKKNSFSYVPTLLSVLPQLCNL